MTSPLPPLRRIVTGHNDTGQATIKYDDKVTAKIVPQGVALRSLGITDSSPVDLLSLGGNADAEVGFVNNGSVFRIVDFPPRSSGYMHHVISIDYVIVQKGTVVLVLDDECKTSVGEGDVVVQQGTMHGWDSYG
ncbi:cupin domain-containing protein [Fusarium mundagurra]|uniref:Cupin domain-containing protein n=1 Tax=Fusarium mundagurra TaxID=1567541 RepID=A0A8H5YMS1_9HYPO|nr:cupin domain-containing protein [Fusarium mundagurra]